MFFSCRGAKQGWTGVPAIASLRAGAGGSVQAIPAIASLQTGTGGPVQAVRTSIFFWRQVNVCWCHEFWSNSKNKFRRCEKFSVMFNHDFGSSSFGQVN